MAVGKGENANTLDAEAPGETTGEPGLAGVAGASLKELGAAPGETAEEPNFAGVGGARLKTPGASGEITGGLGFAAPPGDAKPKRLGAGDPVKTADELGLPGAAGERGEGG